jgi:hypothetical protein
MMPTVRGVNPIWVMNSFSTGTQRMRPCRPTATCSGTNRRASVRGTAGSAATAVLTGRLPA